MAQRSTLIASSAGISSILVSPAVSFSRREAAQCNSPLSRPDSASTRAKRDPSSLPLIIAAVCSFGNIVRSSSAVQGISGYSIDKDSPLEPTAGAYDATSTILLPFRFSRVLKQLNGPELASKKHKLDFSKSTDEAESRLGTVSSHVRSSSSIGILRVYTRSRAHDCCRC